jgi:serine protease Do
MGLRRLLAAGALFAGLFVCAPAGAQGLSDRATQRCVAAAVRLEVSFGGGSSTGSGTMIDPRGYILTNFHVVGFTRHEEGAGAPGRLYAEGDQIRIATVTSARESATPAYVGRVVRGDVRLDLAIVRITGRIDGTPLPSGTTFPTIELTGSEGLNPGAAVWAFGFPMGVRTVNVTSGNISGFEMNADGEVAWIRTDVEFNPGNSGGMLVDRRGRLVAVPTAVVSSSETLEPIELARPAERMPSEWATALAGSDPLETLVLTGLPELSAGAALTDRATGDTGGMASEEIHYFRLPAALGTTGGTITVTPAVPLGLVDSRGVVVREGRGSLVVRGAEVTGLVAILLARGADGAAAEVSVRLDAAPAASGGYAGRGFPPGGYPPGGYPPGSYPPGSYPPGSYPPGGGTYGPSGGAPPAGDVAIRGRLVDAATGTPVPGGTVYIAPASVDIAGLLALYQSRRLTEADFRSALVAVGTTDASGTYAISGLPRGRFAGVTTAPGYVSSPITLTIAPTDVGVIEVTPIRMSR